MFQILILLLCSNFIVYLGINSMFDIYVLVSCILLLHERTLKIGPTKTERRGISISWACSKNVLNLLALEEDQVRHSENFSLLM